MNKEDIRELAEDNAIYEFNKFKKIYGNYTDEYVRHFYNKLAELRGGIDDVHTCNCQHDSNSRDNEPCYKYDSRTAKINKAKVNSLEIIVRMVGDKPYYELKYREVGKEYYSVGYSSYNLKTVLEFIDTYFEIVESDKQTNADRIRNMSDEELAEFNLCPHMVNWKKGNYDTCVHPNDKDACKKCMLDWLQSEAE